MSNLRRTCVFATSIVVVVLAVFADASDQAPDPHGNSQRRVEQLKATVDERQTDLSRLLKLHEENVVSTRDVEDARLAYLFARVRLELSEQELAKIDLRNDLESVVEIVNERLRSFEKLSKVHAVSKAEVDEILLLRSESKALLEFGYIVSIRQRQLARVRALHSQRVASDSDVSFVHSKLVDAVVQLRSLVSELEELPQ